MRVAPRAASAWQSEPGRQGRFRELSNLEAGKSLVADRSVGRIVRSADFVRILKTPIRARSPHFALHHLADKPSMPAKPASSRPPAKLSTGVSPQIGEAVDDSAATALQGSLQDTASGVVTDGLWLGAVVPKRHAKRAVTRTMIKRQIKTAMNAASTSITAGLWVVRLRMPFDRALFPSASSEALVKAVREELRAMFASAARPQRR